MRRASVRDASCGAGRTTLSLKLTMPRARLVGLVRRTRCLVRRQELLEAGGSGLVGGVYNLCTPHHSLRIEAEPGNEHKWLERTPESRGVTPISAHPCSPESPRFRGVLCTVQILVDAGDSVHQCTRAVSCLRQLTPDGRRFGGSRGLSGHAHPPRGSAPLLDFRGITHLRQEFHEVIRPFAYASRPHSLVVLLTCYVDSR